MTSFSGRSPRHTQDLYVDPLQRPGWISGAERLPALGEEVVCAEGVAEVIKHLGKTGNGRLLELKVADGRRAPFFAAAGNVIVAPANSA